MLIGAPPAPDAAISVVIPAYNAGRTIAPALESVLAQSSLPEEIIVVDDGSADDTLEIASAFGGIVKVIKQANQGSAAARQTGTDEARGDYIAYLDADDWWLDNKLAVCRAILRSQPVNFLFADLRRARHGEAEERFLPRNTSFYPIAEQYLDRATAVAGIEQLFALPQEQGLGLILDGFPVYPSTMLVNKQALGAVGGWNPRFRRSQDFDVAIRLARRFPLHFHNVVGAILGLHEVNADVRSYAIMQTKGDIAVLQCHLQHAEDGASRKQFAGALGKKYRSLGYLYRQAGDIERARECYKEAMKLPAKRLRSGARYLVTSTSYFGV